MIKKEFKANTWLECLFLIKIFIEDYNLELCGLELKKNANNYTAIVEYNLGVKR